MIFPAPQPAAAQTQAERFDRRLCLDLTDTGLRLARLAGAGNADIRIGRNQSEFLFAREDKLKVINFGLEVGFGVRVLMNGSWGFAGSSILTEREIERMVALGVENAQAYALIQDVPIVIEDLPAFQEDWAMPVKADPFTAATDIETAHLLALNEAAQKNGADFCHAMVGSVREEKFFGNTRGSAIFQTRAPSCPLSPRPQSTRTAATPPAATACRRRVRRHLKRNRKR